MAPVMFRRGPAPRDRAAPIGASDTADRHGVRFSREIVLLLIIGLGLRLFQYFWNRSLFIDEAALALNIRERSLLGLVGPLDHAQFAPLGFLLLQKTLWFVLGESELVLRAPALLAGGLALWLFAILSRRVLPSHAAWLAVGLFSISYYLIFWSSDAKSYAFDLLAAIGLAILALDHTERPTRGTALRLGAAGAIASYFATPTPFILAGIGAWLVLLHRHWWRRHLVVFGLWLLGLPNVLHSALVTTPEDRAYFAADWWEGFMPLPWQEGAFDSYRDQLLSFLYDPLGFGYPIPATLALVAAITGMVWLFRHERRTLLLLLAPAVVAAAASILGLYPLRQGWPYYGRVVLFLAPAGVILVAAGVAWLRRPAVNAMTGGAIFLLAAMPAIARLPYSRGEPRRAFEYVTAHARPTDTVYLYYGARLAAEYYRPELPGRLVRGTCAQHDWRRYLREVHAAAGASRFWWVGGYDFFDEETRVLGYFRSHASLLDSVRTQKAGAWLFENLRVNPAIEALPPLDYPPFPGTECLGIFDASP